MSRRFARIGWPRGNEVVTGTQMVASATPHTKGPWVSLDASVSRDICGFYIIPTASIGAGAAVDSSLLLDLGVGGVGDAVDQIKVNNIPWGGANTTSTFFIPLHVRAGERLAGRVQSAIVSQTFDARLTLCFADRMPGWGGYSEANTYTANTATSGPTTGDLADNAWDEAVASTTNPIRALTFHGCQPPGDISIQASTIVVDIGYGAGGSEVALGSFVYLASASEVVIPVPAGVLFIEHEIAAGSRLAIRKNSTDDLSGLVIGWR